MRPASSEEAAKAWIDGYWSCTPLDGPPVRLAVGTSNLGSQVTFAHGRAWAMLVNDLLAYTIAHGFDEQISVAGASNIELDWNTPAATKDWLNGYASAFQRVVYHVGDCSGCPYPAHPDWLPNNGWTYEDMYAATWGILPSRPFPEIYAPGTSAAQWQALAVWASDIHHTRIHFAGAFTQFQACIDRGTPCTGVNNTPAVGWSQFYTALHQDAKTDQIPDWLTDVRWNF